MVNCQLGYNHVSWKSRNKGHFLLHFPSMFMVFLQLQKLLYPRGWFIYLFLMNRFELFIFWLYENHIIWKSWELLPMHLFISANFQIFKFSVLRKNGIIVHHFWTRLSNYAKMIQLHNTYNKSAILFQKYLKCNFHHRHAIKNLRCYGNNVGKC